jgi:hypothetical protein
MTAQISDVLLMNGECHSVFISGSQSPPLPISSRIVIADNADNIFTSNACRRKYQALWEITGGALYLKDLKGKYSLSDGEGILADHFTGILKVPKGDMLKYVHMGYSTVFSEELHISVRRGLVLRTRLVDTQEMERRWAKFKTVLFSPILFHLVTVVLPIVLAASALALAVAKAIRFGFSLWRHIKCSQGH